MFFSPPAAWRSALRSCPVTLCGVVSSCHRRHRSVSAGTPGATVAVDGRAGVGVGRVRGVLVVGWGAGVGVGVAAGSGAGAGTPSDAKIAWAGRWAGSGRWPVRAARAVPPTVRMATAAATVIAILLTDGGTGTRFFPLG